MNTMPQIFDDEPVTRASFSVSGPAAAAPLRRVPAPHLRLVGVTDEALAPAVASDIAIPYDLSARRHLARVPERQTPPQRPQAPGAGADNPSSSSPRAPWEPLVFALVLLMSVAALAMALRGAG